MSYSSLLIQRCSIERKTNTLNEYAQMQQVWKELYKEIPCRLDKIGNFTSTLAQTPTGQTSRNEFVCFMLPNQDILSGDRIKVDDIYFYVTPFLKVHDGKKLHHKEVFVSIQET
jgi:hypothetical protein